MTPAPPLQYQQPQYTNYFSQADQALQQARTAAMPSAAARDTAAARVRSRVAGQTKANMQQVDDAYTRRGSFYGSGGRDRALRSVQAAGDNALATGLADVELGFLDKQQQGANILSGIGNQYGQLGTSYNKLGMDYDLGRYGIDTNLQSAREQRELDKLLGQGKLDLERYGIDKSSYLQDRQNQIDLLSALGLYGNTRGGYDERGEIFNEQFMGVIESLLGGGQFGGLPVPTQTRPTTRPARMTRDFPHGRILP